MAQPPNPPAAAPIPAANLGPLQNSFQQLQMELRAGRLGREITKFNGEGYKKFRQWLNDMERYRTALNAGDNATLSMCFESLRGTAADFLTRTIQQNPNITWQNFRQLMVGQYSDISDAHIALQTLRKIKQRSGESVQGFAERIRQLADEAYPQVNLQQGLIQNSLIEAFIDGVHNDGIAKKLMRNRPQFQNFDQAVDAAVQEQQVTKQFGVRRSGEEPMDVSVVRSRSSPSPVEVKLDNLCDKLNRLVSLNEEPEEKFVNPEQEIAQLNLKLAKLERQVKGQRGPNPSRFQPPPRSTKKFSWTPTGQPICGYCDKAGHMIRDCRSRKHELA